MNSGTITIAHYAVATEGNVHSCGYSITCTLPAELELSKHVDNHHECAEDFALMYIVAFNIEVSVARG